MGNQQSNEKPKKRIIFIEPRQKESAKMISYNFVRKEAKADFIRFYFDNYLFYKDGDFKYIDFSFNKEDTSIEYRLGRLDMNYICKHNHTKTFSYDEEYWDVIGETKPRIEEVWKDSDGNFRDSNGNIITDTVKLIAGFGEAFEGRQEFIASMEQSRYANNHAWTKQTSWDMP